MIKKALRKFLEFSFFVLLITFCGIVDRFSHAADVDVFTMEKQPTDRRSRSVDFAEKVPDGVTIESATVAAVKVDTLEDVADDLLDSENGSVSGTKVSFIVKGGEDGGRYKITISATLSNDDVLTADIFLSVRER